MIQSDIETIENLCVTNKNASKICNNKSFWKALFNRDNLSYPVRDVPKTIDEWIDGYNLEQFISEFPIIYNLLLQSTRETIGNLCITNKDAYKICNNKSFWRNKFHNDGLPFDSQKQYNTVNEWIKEYNDTFIETLIVTFIDKVMLETNPGQSRKIYQNYIYSPQYISPELLVPENLEYLINYKHKNYSKSRKVDISTIHFEIQRDINNNYIYIIHFDELVPIKMDYENFIDTLINFMQHVQVPYEYNLHGFFYVEGIPLWGL